MRYLILASFVLVAVGCQSTVNGYVDEYLNEVETRSISDAKQAASDVNAPIELYADLWDANADPANRLRLAGILISDMVRNGVQPQSIVHVTLSVAVMLAHQYRGKP